MGQLLQFAEFRLDPVTGRLWRDDEAQDLTPKAFTILLYLASRPQQLVPKEELLNAAWGDAFVGDAVLKVTVAELRRVLGDDPKNPRFIQTAHRRGYRFIGEATTSQSSGLIGRDVPMGTLRESLQEALTGRRQTVFITGEPGIGKSTLLDTFLANVPGHTLVARGQCLQQYGESEPYLPVLDALGRLVRTPGMDSFAALLRRHAPTWAAHMVPVAAGMDREALSRDVLGATRERMLREMAECIETLAADRPLVLALEDLHWSDVSTVDLVSALAWRTVPARFLLIGTYRPVEVIVQEHPIKSVKQDLLVQSRGTEVPLQLLTDEDVAAMIAERCGKHDFPGEFPDWLFERTNGNPLFVINVLDFVAAEENGKKSLRAPLDELASEIPDTLRQMIGKQVDRLTEAEQEMLEAAAVAGLDFPSVAIGAGLGHDSVAVEEQCERLVRRGQFLASSGIRELPDGTLAGRFRFLHPLYQAVLYQRIGPARRARLHQRIGEQAERVYGERADEIAAELAMQFESANDYPRTVKYLRMAAANALRRYANREAVDFLTRALDAAAKFPKQQRVETEMVLFEERGLAYRSMGEMSAAAKEFASAVRHAAEVEDISAEVKALLFQTSAVSWLDHEACIALADEAVKLSSWADDEVLRAHARGYCGYWHLVLRGWREQDAEASREAIRIVRGANHRGLLAMHLSRHSYFESLRSEYGQAVETAEEGMRLAIEEGDAFEYILGQYFRLWALILRGRWGEARTGLDHAIMLAATNEHRQWSVLFKLMSVWLHLEVEDYARARELGEEALQAGREASHPLSKQMALVLLGFARLGCGDPVGAEKCFHELSAWSAMERILMDWIWQIPMSYGQCLCALERGDLIAAKRWAVDMCSRAGQPGERTWLGLGHLALARVAEQAGDEKEREWELAVALEQTNAGTPLAAWRIHDYAARWDVSGHHRKEADRIVAELRSTFASDDAMREAPVFHRILGHRRAKRPSEWEEAATA